MSLFEGFVDGLVGLSDSVGSWVNSLRLEDLSRVLNGAQLGLNAYGAVTRYREQGRRADEARSSIDAAEQANIGTLREQQAQREDQVQQQVSERARQAMIERARLRAIASSAGLEGPSAQDYQQVSQLNLATDVATAQSNLASSERQTARSIEATQARARSDRNRIVEPSLFSTGLELLGGLTNYARVDQKARVPDMGAWRIRKGSSYE